MKVRPSTQTRRKRRAGRPFRRRSVAAPFIFLAVCCHQCFFSAAAEEQVTWTPNDDVADGSNPSLPLSMKQRKQLLQLQQAIMQSPDPQATLEQVAQSNQMSASDLIGMLEKNARDLQADPTLLDPVMLPQLVWKSTMGVAAAISSVAKRNPKAFSAILSSIVLIMYLSLVVIPNTGMQLSAGRSILSPNGPTTVWMPPDQYIQRLLDKQHQQMRPSTDSILRLDFDDDSISILYESDGDNDSSKTEKRQQQQRRYHSTANQFSQVISSKVKVLADDVLLEAIDIDDDQREDITHMLFVNGRKTMIDRKLSEFSHYNDDNDGKSSSRYALRCVVSHDDIDSGILVVPGLGDFGFVGLMFWKVTDEQDSIAGGGDDSGDSTTATTAPTRFASSSLTLSTIEGLSAFDGQIHIMVRQIFDDGDDDQGNDDEGEDVDADEIDNKSYSNALVGVEFQVHLVVPKNSATGGKCKKISQRTGQKITNQIASSLRQSSIQSTRQILVRRQQGRRFQQSGSKRATDRRNTRFERERLLEEMAEDRRRKWQRRNPDAGRYRPSGHRQRSPNNC